MNLPVYQIVAGSKPELVIKIHDATEEERCRAKPIYDGTGKNISGLLIPSCRFRVDIAGRTEQENEWLFTWVLNWWSRKAHSEKPRKPGKMLTQDEIVSIANRSRGLCELTGVSLILADSGARRHPYTPSIDRIDSSIGYTRDNSRIVCVAANIALSDWGEEVFSTLAISYVKRRSGC